MAVFEQRESGWWQAKIRRKGFPSQSKTFRTKLGAQVWARAIESGIDKGTHVSTVAAERTLFKDLAARFSTEFAPFHYRGMGWKHKLAHLVKHFGTHSVASLTADKIALYRDQRLTDPDPRFSDAEKAPRISGATVKTELDLLSKVLDVASKEFRMTLPTGNAVALIRKPANNPSRERRLTAEEFDKLVAACDRSSNRWLKPALLLSVETAMRQGELLALNWDNVNFEKRIAFLKVTKNGDARAVPLSGRAIEVLQSIPRADRNRVLLVEKQGLHSVFKTACKRAKIEDFTWHDLRHESISRYAERGDFSILELASISGHKTLQMLKKYTHLQAEKLAAKIG